MRNSAARLTGGGLDAPNLVGLDDAAGNLTGTHLALDPHLIPQKARRHNPEDRSLEGLFYMPEENRRGKVFHYS